MSTRDNDEEVLSTSVNSKGDDSSISTYENLEECQSTSSSDISSEDESSTSCNNDDERGLEAPVIYSDENKLIEESTHDITILLSYLNLLLKRTRKVVNLIHKSSVLDRYVKIQIKKHRKDIGNSSNNQHQQQKNFEDFIIDFPIRWNTTYMMLE